MADDFDRDTAGPRDWSQAFAALPTESAPAEAWSRLAAALDAQAAHPNTRIAPRRPSRTAWIAIAAAVTAIAVLPLAGQWSVDPALPAGPSPRVLATTSAPGSNTRIPARSAAPEPGRSPPDAEAIASERSVAATDSTSTGTARAPTRPIRRPAQPAAAIPQADAPRRVVAAASGRDHDVEARADASDRSDTSISAGIASRTATAPDPLQALYAESAQLEALVALTRDDRVASASGAVLTGEVGSRLGVIDALLSQPGLSSAERETLWRQRIAALRQLAGIESTERWLAAHGEAFGDALVRVD